MLIVSTACFLLLSALVLSRRPWQALNVSLIVATLITLVWSFLVYGLGTSLGSFAWYARIIFFVGLLSLVGILAFASLLVYKYVYRLGRIWPFGIAYAGLLAVVGYLTTFTDTIVQSILRDQMLIQPVYGSMFWVYVAFITSTILLIIVLLWYGIRSTRDKDRNQIATVAMTIILSITIIMLTNFILPIVTGDTTIANMMPLGFLVLMTGLTLAIVRNGLFDVKLTVVRGVAYIAAIFTMGGVYYALIYIISSTLFRGQASTAVSVSPVNILLALILALIFQPLKRFFDQITDIIFYRDEYSPQETLDKIGIVVSRTTNVEQLLKDVLGIMKTSIDPIAAWFVLVDSSGAIVLTRGYGEKMNIEDILKGLRHREEKLVVAGLSGNDQFHAVMGKNGATVVARLNTVSRVSGYLILGEKMSGGMYTRRDFNFLSVMTDELAVAVENTRQYEEIRAFSETLQEKVEAATHDLRVSNRKLRMMDQTKDEFISLTSHQLRTPLTTIKGYLSMLLDGDVGEMDPQQRKLVEEAFNSSQRMVHLISDFLNISRIQTGKFVIDLADVNLADILDEEIDQLRISANSRQLTLQYDKPDNFPIMSVDEGKIRQVMMNFIDNAIYYSLGGSTITIILSYTASTVEFKVIDQGIGVPKAEQHRLFAKFSRASNAKKQRPDGTGIGLFMAKKVIVALEGSIIFKSEEGKGSTFGFRLNRPSA